MYRIIGSDGKEYGPVTLELLRQWVHEGRVNAHTRVRLESATEWTTLGALADFSIPAPPPSGGIVVPQPGLNAEAARTVQAPAIVLMLIAGVGFFWSLMSLVLYATGAMRQTWRPIHQSPEMDKLLDAISGGAGVATSLLGMAVSIFLLFSALQMYRLKHYGLAFAGAIIVMVPCISPCCCLGLPAGVWALVVLSRPEVKAAFH